MQKLSMYVASLRHLKPVQIWGRVSLLARRKILHRTAAYVARYQNGAHASLRVTPLPCAAQPLHRSQLADAERGHFTFLNRRVDVGQPTNWFPAGVTQLWHYNLHYFDYAAAMGWDYAHEGRTDAYATFRRLAAEWIEACPVATPIAWDPYPISLRVSNWIKAYTFFLPALIEDEAFAAILRRSLYNQTKWLADHLEYHLLGNHLIENGRALLLAGLFFTGEQAARWRREGERILWRELREQFLQDGAHYERSPMYHQIMLALYREVVAVLDGQEHAVPAPVRSQVDAMGDWLAAMLHPDGEIALFNDAAFDIAGPPAVLVERTPSTVSGLHALADSGYFVFRNGPARHAMLLDCGALGPDYQPGHGHCDALSYELSLDGQRFIVDAGVENYYGGLDWRLYYRGTRAHNTVVVDGAEQSEIWSRFRVARRAQPEDVCWADDAALSYVIGAHTGYRRLAGQVVHRRWVCWIDRRFWLVCDRISGRGAHRAESLIHWHPEVAVVEMPTLRGDGVTNGLVRRGATELTVAPWGVQRINTYCGETDPIQGWYAPQFGVKMQNTVWGLCREGALPGWFGYALWPDSHPVVVQCVAATEDACELDVQAAAIKYKIYCHSNYVTMENV